MLGEPSFSSEFSLTVIQYALLQGNVEAYRYLVKQGIDSQLNVELRVSAFVDLEDKR